MIVLLSAMPGMSVGMTVAAATSGPAREPRPASSIPITKVSTGTVCLISFSRVLEVVFVFFRVVPTVGFFFFVGLFVVLIGMGLGLSMVLVADNGKKLYRGVVWAGCVCEPSVRD